MRIDGITLAPHLAQMRILHPYYNLDAQIPTPGSRHADRVFVRDKSVRELLLLFAPPPPLHAVLRGGQHRGGGGQQQGLSPVQHTALLEALEALGPDAQEAALVPFVEDAVAGPGGGLLAQPGAERDMLYCLATEAPTCQVMRPQVFPLVQQLMQSPAALLSAGQQRELECLSPILARFLRRHIGAGLPPQMRVLLDRLLVVAERCLVPQPAGVQEMPVHAVAAAAAASSRGAAAFQEHMSSGGRPPEQWSREEAFLRTACWGGPCSSQPWQPTAYGGSDILHPIPRYAMDGTAERRGCTKHKDQHKSLGPGLLVVSCGVCRKVVFFQVRGYEPLLGGCGGGVEVGGGVVVVGWWGGGGGAPAGGPL